MQPPGSPVVAGATEINVGTAYAAGQPGWLTAPNYEHARTSLGYIPSELDPDLYLDGISASSPISFRADIANGDYRVVLYLGDAVNTRAPGAGGIDYVRVEQDISLEGVQLATGVWSRTLIEKASTTYFLGAHRRIELRTTVQDGALDIDLSPSGGHRRVALMGVEVYQDEPEPLRLDTGTGALEPEVSFGTSFDPFITAMAAAQYDTAKTEALAITDDLARAYALATLAGWMTGEEEDLDLGLLLSAEAALASYNNPTDIRSASLAADIDVMQLALQYNDARGYSQYLVPISLPDPTDPSKVSIVSNLSAAVMLFENVQSDLYGALAAGQPQSPLFPRAQYLIARNHYSRNTKQGNPTAEFNSYWMDIFQSLALLDQNHGVFPDAHALEMFDFMVTAYPGVGGIIKNWDSVSTPSFDPADAWWADLMEVATNPSAPTWANLQRQYYQGYRNVADWWMTERLIGPEIGGGTGDDVEGGAILALPSAIVAETDNVGDQGANLVLEAALFGPKVNQEEGFFTGDCGDVEHTAEFTTNPMFILLPSNFGSPKHWELAHLTLRNLADQGPVDSWSTVTPANNRQFKTYFFDDVDFCGPTEEDVPMTLRAVIPGFSLIDYSSHPRVIELFEEIADTWIGHLQSTADGKPAGVFPASVDHGNPPSFSDGGGWWLASQPGYSMQLLPTPKNRNQSYLYSLARSMYLSSDDTNPERFLLPIFEGSKLMARHAAGQTVGTTAGSEAWAAELLQGVIGNAVAESRAYFDDPAVQSALGVTAQDLTDMDDTVIPTYAGGWQNFITDTSVTKDKTFIEEDFEYAVRWLRYFFPLGTSAVTYADRIHAFTGSNDENRQFSMQVMYQTMLGGAYDFVPSFPVSWANPDPAEELDVAILVLGGTEETLKVLLFNFETTDRLVQTRFWRGLKPGQYNIFLGEDDDFDDQADPGTNTQIATNFSIASKGTEFEFNLPAGKLHVLEVDFVPGTEVPTQLLGDLAISDEDLVYDPVGGTLTALIHNLGAVDITGATMDVFENGAARWTGLPISATIPAPLNFDPAPYPMRGSYTPNQGTTNIQIVLHAPGAEITTSNNTASIDI